MREQNSMQIDPDFDPDLPRSVWYRGTWFNKDGKGCGNQKSIQYIITRWINNPLDPEEVEKILGIHESGQITPHSERSAAVRPVRMYRTIYFRDDGSRKVEDTPFEG